MANPEVVTAATTDAITVAEVREQFKYTETAEDGLLAAYISAATAYLERWLRRAFVTRSYRLRLESFQPADAMIPSPDNSREILLPYPPLIQVTAVKYDDVDGVPQTFSSDDWIEDIYSEPGRVKPAPDSAWPSIYAGGYGAVRIEYDAGYGAAADVPEDIKQILRWIVATWFRNREPVAPAQLAAVPHTVEDFVSQLKEYRVE